MIKPRDLKLKAVLMFARDERHLDGSVRQRIRYFVVEQLPGTTNWLGSTAFQCRELEMGAFGTMWLHADGCGAHFDPSKESEFGGIYDVVRGPVEAHEVNMYIAAHIKAAEQAERAAMLHRQSLQSNVAIFRSIADIPAPSG